MGTRPTTIEQVWRDQAGFPEEDPFLETAMVNLAESPNVATQPVSLLSLRPTPEIGPIESLRAHWPEYLMEAALLGCFMVSACVFTVLLEFPKSWARQALASALLRRFLNGLCMGLTALGIIYSPWGKQSGAHINPSITLTFLRLGKIKYWDAFFYICAQFAGATIAVFAMVTLLGSWLSDPSVAYAVTIPGDYGRLTAALAEFLISAGMMLVVLYASNHASLSRYTGVFAATLVIAYITLESPFSGMSMNPARSFGSAFPSTIWSSFWIYLVMPPLAMLAAAQFYLWRRDKSAVRCCKLHHENTKRCIFCGTDGGFIS